MVELQDEIRAGRRSTIAIHVAKKQLGLDEDTYRAKLVNAVGKSSTKDMSEDERQKVLDIFRNDGFRSLSAPRRPDGRRKLTGKYAGILQALWITGWNLGIVAEKDDAALIGFVKRQTGIDAVQFLRHQEDAQKIIEALKAILARDGGVDWSKSRFMPKWTQTDGYRIANAQWRKLGKPGDFWTLARDAVGTEITIMAMTSGNWIKVMNHFGKQIREQKAEASSS